jgi:hypothetical protein
MFEYFSEINFHFYKEGVSFFFLWNNNAEKGLILILHVSDQNFLNLDSKIFRAQDYFCKNF